MLERAKACLQSGARDTLQCARTAARSKRLLHSTFWNHGAGALDLPPWALSMMPIPAELSLTDDSIRRRGVGKSRAGYVGGKGNGVEDGIFLDCLYPPQALLWLNRTGATGQQWERWEKRNARRLPEGFFPASRGRGFASRSYTAPTAKSTSRKREDARQGGLEGQRQRVVKSSATELAGGSTSTHTSNAKGFGDSSGDLAELESEGDQMSSPVASDLRPNPDEASLHADELLAFSIVENDSVETDATRSLVEETWGTQLTQNTPLFDWKMDTDSGDQEWLNLSAKDQSVLFLDINESERDTLDDQAREGIIFKIGDTAADELVDNPTDAVQKLSNIIAYSRDSFSRTGPNQKSKSLADKAWSIFQSLGDERIDDRLRIELMTWLSLHEDPEIDIHCASLYSRIPREQRTLAVYQAALSVFLRRDMRVQAVKLHKEALKTIPNGDQITKVLFRHAVDVHNWQLATLVAKDHRLQYASAESAYQRDMFWVNVSTIPKLLSKALNLARYMRVANRSGTKDPSVRAFNAYFAQEALVQEFESRSTDSELISFTSRDLPKHSVRSLIDFVSGVGKEAPKILEKIAQILTRPDSRFDDSITHSIVSYIYFKLRKQKVYTVPEHLLQALLSHISRHWSTKQIWSEVRNSVTIKKLTKDWIRYHSRVGRPGVASLLSLYASQGMLQDFDEWFAYLQTTYPGYEELKSELWKTIYVHARRANALEAQRAFNRAKAITADHGEQPELKCWNVLLYAKQRADDLDGAVDQLQSMLDKALQPGAYTFHAVAEMLAARGDVDGVRDLLDQYDDVVREKRETALLRSLLTAHVKCGDIRQAENVLRDALADVRSGKVRGSLTGCFNTVITAYGQRRNVTAAMSTFEWMKAEKIRADTNTYAALIQALCLRSQTDAAWNLLRVVMKKEGLKPTAFHYATVMAGYVNQRMFQEALAVHSYMVKRNIKRSLSTNIAYFKAKALREQESIQFRRTPDGRTLAPNLDAVLTDLKQTLGSRQGIELVEKGQTGLGGMSLPAASQAADFDFLIFIHGQQQCFEAVQQLYRDYEDRAKKTGDQNQTQPPLRLIGSLMAACVRAGEHDTVKKLWKLAKDQSDDAAKSKPVLLVKNRTPDPEPEHNEPALPPPAPHDAHEAGFQVSIPPTANAVSPARGAEQKLLTEKVAAPSPPRPSPARKHLLSRPLRFYIDSLAVQERFQELITVVTAYLRQGYIMDSRTWNLLVQKLCAASPPLVLLAFQMTERFLIPRFPGWSTAKVEKHRAGGPAQRQGLQYIHTRYERPDRVLPTYATLVYLGSALLRLRRMEATGFRGSDDRQKLRELERYIGSTRQVRQQAPRTLFAVQSMPVVDDWLQRNLLRRE